MSYDLAAMARASGSRRGEIRLRPLTDRLVVRQTLYQIVMSVIGELRGFRAALLSSASATRAAFLRDETPFGAVMRRLRGSFTQATMFAEGRLSQMLSREARRHNERWIDQVNRVLGIDLRAVVTQPAVQPAIDVAVQTNVALIRGLSDDVARRIETQVLELVTRGASNREIAKTLAEVGGFAKKRAKLIAVDQAAKFNGALNEIRQREAGVSAYIWKTVGDERVRPLHRARNGQRFRWDSPPSDGHPGRPVRCRCVAAPVLDLDAPRRRSVRASREGFRAVEMALGAFQ